MSPSEAETARIRNDSKLIEEQARKTRAEMELLDEQTTQTRLGNTGGGSSSSMGGGSGGGISTSTFYGDRVALPANPYGIRSRAIANQVVANEQAAQKPSVTIINRMDPSVALEAQQSAEGRAVFVNMIQSDREAIRAILGVA